MISPLLLLIVLLGLTGLAWAAGRVARHRRVRAMRELAGRWQMRFVQEDLFQLAHQIGGRLPVPGAANLRVRDVVYGAEGAAHRYVFTAEYTLGATGRHRREARAVVFLDSAGPSSAAAEANLQMASEHLSLPEQYESLRETDWGRSRPAAGDAAARLPSAK